MHKPSLGGLEGKPPLGGVGGVKLPTGGWGGVKSQGVGKKIHSLFGILAKA